MLKPNSARTQELVKEQRHSIAVKMDRMFSAVMLVQWLVEILLALSLSPLTWSGAHSWIHPHIWLVLWVGGGLTLPCLVLARVRPGWLGTRMCIATCQMLHSGILIHVTGGRIETHFHIFSSLAFLSFYRDRRVLVPATLVVIMDHLLRGIMMPMSVYGVAQASLWRTFEHGWWVALEVAALLYGIRVSVQEMEKIASQRADLESVNERVEAEVAARTNELVASRQFLESQAAELRVARDRALESTRAKSQFLANMSHEVRTPMNGVLGMSALLAETPLSVEQSELVRCVKSSAENLLTVLNDILDFSKIEAGKLSLEPVNFDLAQTMEDVCELFAAQAQSKQLELVCWVPPTVPTRLRGDVGRLHQILGNLVGNAVKFTTGGEVLVRCELLTATQDRAHVRLVVKDTGIGIHPDKLSAILEPFTQADNSTTRRYGGTGLGLSISKQLAELMGGSLAVSSELAVGSEFSVDLPFDLSSADAPESGPEPLRGLQVLIVDDNPTNRYVLREQLRHRGCSVVETTGGPEALNVLAQPDADFDVLLLDMMMPDMDGLELARRIRALPAQAAVPIILLTSMGVNRQELGAQMVNRVLSKPLRATVLSSVIAECLTAPSEPPAPLPAAQAEAALNLRVLVAEDNTVNQRVVCKMLDFLGCQSQAVANGFEALAALQEFSYDLVLMDMQMPDMDGLEATRLIREGERATGRHIPIVAMTANAMHSDRNACLAAGMDEYLAKPLNPAALREKLLAVAPR